jgi:hypothetical protein
MQAGSQGVRELLIMGIGKQNALVWTLAKQRFTCIHSNFFP